MNEERASLDDSKMPENKVKELTKEQYFKLLQEWVNLQNAFRAMTYLPLLNQNQSATATSSTVTSSANQNQQQQQQNRNIQANRWFDDGARAEEIIQANGGFEMVISPLYKRFLAEVLDTIILFVIKIAVFVILIDLLDINIALDIDITDLKDMKFLEDDYSQLLNLSSEFIVLEFLTKLLSCLYEAIFAIRFGGTLGKLVMGIKIVQADAVIALEPQVNQGSQGIRALIFPASNLTFIRAFIRALAKNLLVTLLFPVYFMLFFYRSNQLIYDMFCKTVVVDNNPPVFRRRN